MYRVALPWAPRHTLEDACGNLGGTPVTGLNELEIVEGQIFSNIWQTDRIVRISPSSGRVLGWIDLQGLLSPMCRLQDNAVLNGIAYDPGSKRLFVTGKLWPRIFEIRIVPQAARAAEENPPGA